ncbi:hypothetical protein [Ereboglobus luteus]|uniref:Phage tail collar domain-containing protein n=1 Tax=Ereboglobus luteus TaxID=1796921 RepID=A0A2U8E6Z8_9BACT|nr:hypothetical protein [Ereboglobus luteus]AWI10322.1 hypothetical protein CKA38_14610 [Ereboglobus luteus]
MSKIKRTIQRIFGGDVGLDGNISVFGSLSAGNPKYAGSLPASDNPLDDIQNLPGYGRGWTGATIRNNIAPLQDMNALQYLFSSQIAYLMQSGVPEWHKDQEYHEGSFCSYNNTLYVATNTVVGKSNPNPKDDTNNWRPYAMISIGTTENRKRLESPSTGHIYYDIDIPRWLTWNGRWTTIEGSPGDIKMVHANSIDEAEERNPGWVHYVTSKEHPDFKNSVGRVIASADPNNGAKSSGSINEPKESIILSVANLPPHTHDYEDVGFLEQLSKTGTIKNRKKSEYEGYIGSKATDWDNDMQVFRNAVTKSTGSSDPISIMQPTLYAWCLIKL